MIAFWLMPEACAREAFRAMIAQLAAEHEAPVFEPHVTLAAGDFEKAAALRCLRQITAPPVALDVHAVRFSDAFTKTVFVQFHSTEAANELSSRIAQQLCDSGLYDFDPHLSLIYKTMPRPQKEALAERVSIPLARVTFDAVRLITGAPSTRSASDVEGWRTLREVPLAGRAK